MIICITHKLMLTRMNGERCDLYKALEKLGCLVVYIENHERSLSDIFQTRGINNITGIIFEEPVWNLKLGFVTKFIDAKKFDVPKATFISDYHLYIPYAKKYINENDIKIVFTAHQISIPILYKTYRNLRQIFHIPFCIREEDYFGNETREIDILDTVALHPETPLRNRISLIASKIPNIKYFKLHHPGTRIESTFGKTVGTDYIKLIHNSYFTITCSTWLNVSVRKYWEISAAGSIILGDKPELPEFNRIKDSIVNIKSDDSDREIERKILLALTEKKRLSTLSRSNSRKIINYAGREALAKRIIGYMNTDEAIVLARAANYMQPAKVIRMHNRSFKKIYNARGYIMRFIRKLNE